MMTKTETNALPGEAIPSRFGLQIVCRAILGIALVISGAPVATTAAQQDAAEAARQERARKQSETAPASHVYTNDDLARHEILTPADRSRYIAARAPETAAPVVQAATIAAPAEQAPLGDVARFYRAQREEEARATPRTAPPASPRNAFPLMASSTPLAAMKQSPAHSPAPETSVWPTRSRDPFVRSQSPLGGNHAANKASVTATPLTPKRIDPSVAPVVARTQTGHPAIAAPIAQKNMATLRIASVLVVEGDTLWSLSRKYLGSGTKWKQIVAVNPGIEDPRQLRAGSQLVLPAPQA